MTLQSNVKPSDFTSDANLLSKIFDKMLGEASFIELVQVTAVDGLTCTVKPLLAKRDAVGNKVATIEVSGIPFMRLQMGVSAVLMNPKVGDKGLLLCCDRDISNILATGQESMVATGFTHVKKDGIYLGGVGLLGATPTEYIEFTGTGINMVSTGTININGVQITSAGSLIFNNGVVGESHIHSQGSDSNGDAEQDTGAPHN